MDIPPLTFDIEGFKALVEKHWNYHAPCQHLKWKVDRTGIDSVQVEAAPIFQDILGGAEDGKRVWSAFQVDLSKLLAEPGIEVEEFGFVSYCVECTAVPFVGVRGKFMNTGFLLKLYLEPIPNSEPVEIIDTLKKETRAIKEKQK